MALDHAGILTLSDGVGHKGWGCDAMRCCCCPPFSSFIIRDWQTRLAFGGTFLSCGIRMCHSKRAGGQHSRSGVAEEMGIRGEPFRMVQRPVVTAAACTILDGRMWIAARILLGRMTGAAFEEA